jgi:hypothetical protein
MDRKKIPFSNDFYIDTSGIVFDKHGAVRNTSLNGDGYVTVNIKTNENLWITFGVHRLAALTHIPKGRPDQIQVNHRDLDITNNHISNLEWVSNLENVIHSEIMRVDNPTISVYSVDSNGIQRGYRNAHEAAVVNCCAALDIWDSIKNNSEFNGVRFYFRKRSDPLPLSLKHDRRKNFTLDNRPVARSVKTLDIYSGKELHFTSIGEAAKHFQTHPSHVFQAISKTSYPRVFQKRYQVAYLEDTFPAMTVAEKERAKAHGRKKVLAYDTSHCKYLVFSSAVEFIKHTQLSKKAVAVNLKKNQLREIGGWIAVYLSDENAKLLKSHISGPAEL